MAPDPLSIERRFRELEALLEKTVAPDPLRKVVNPVPPTVSGITVEKTGIDSFLLTWEPINSPLRWYEVQIAENIGFTQALQTITTSDTFVRATRQNNVAIMFARVRAVTDTGIGEWSAVGQATFILLTTEDFVLGAATTRYAYSTIGLYGYEWRYGVQGSSGVWFTLEDPLNFPEWGRAEILIPPTNEELWIICSLTTLSLASGGWDLPMALRLAANGQTLTEWPGVSILGNGPIVGSLRAAVPVYRTTVHFLSPGEGSTSISIDAMWETVSGGGDSFGFLVSDVTLAVIETKR